MGSANRQKSLQPGSVVADTFSPEQIPVEEPELSFARYAIAFHLAATRSDSKDVDRRLELEPDPDEIEVERAMASYEDDMLLYAHRDDAPFATRIRPAVLTDVTVRFPPELAYAAEGIVTRRRCADATEAGRLRRFRVTLAETEFKPGDVAVLSLVLTPAEPGSAQSVVNEFDVIKLAKLWEGGEGLPGAASAIDEGDDPNVWFATKPNERVTLHTLAARAFPGWTPAGAVKNEPTTARNGYRVGTVELELRPEDWTHELFCDLAVFKGSGEAPRSDPDGKRLSRVVAVGGILQGLLGFGEITGDELADVFAAIDVDADGETMRAFHKGSLLALSTEADEQGERLPPMGVDPYLAVPNIVLLYSEQRLKTARRTVNDLSANQRTRIRDRAAIGATEDGLSTIAGILAQQLPNVFHYPSEQELQQRGRESRGLDDLDTYVRLRMDDLRSVLESRVRLRDRMTAVVGIAVGVVTAFLVQQAIEGKPLWAIFAAAVALLAVFLWLRDKLF